MDLCFESMPLPCVIAQKASLLKDDCTPANVILPQLDLSPVEQKIESPETSIGFIAGTGLVFYPVPPYISIEVNAGYSLFSINEMEFDGGGLLAKNEDSNEAMDNFIDGGGFFAFAHLMVSIPFN